MENNSDLVKRKEKEQHKSRVRAKAKAIRQKFVVSIPKMEQTKPSVVSPIGKKDRKKLREALVEEFRKARTEYRAGKGATFKPGDIVKVIVKRFPAIPKKEVEDLLTEYLAHCALVKVIVKVDTKESATKNDNEKQNPMGGNPEDVKTTVFDNTDKIKKAIREEFSKPSNEYKTGTGTFKTGDIIKAVMKRYPSFEKDMVEHFLLEYVGDVGGMTPDK